MSMESLADILSGAEESAPSETASTPETVETTDVKPAEPAKEAPAATSAAKTEETKADVTAKEAGADTKVEQARNEKGEFASPEEIKKLRDELAARSKAHETEKRKRQELERLAKDLEAAKKQDGPKKDFWEDPDAALEERLSPREEKLRLESESRFFSLCEDLAKEKHADYDDVVNELLTEAQEDASLGSQVFAQAKAARNPAEFLYTYALNRREMKAVGGDLGKYKETVTAEFKTKVAERDQRISTLEGEIKALKTQLDNIGKVPSSLNSEPSATRASVTAESVEHEPLEEIVKPRKRRA